MTRDRYDELTVEPDANCTSHNATMETCFCPLDMTGAYCELPRPYECTTEMHEPILACEEPEDNVEIGGLKIDGDFPCLRYRSDDTVDFVFSVQCRFTGEPDFVTYHSEVPRDEDVMFTILGVDPIEGNLTWTDIRQRFQYAIYSNESRVALATDNGVQTLDPQFALRELPTVPMSLRPFNFYSMGDLTHVLDVHLDEVDYFLNQRRFTYRLNISTLPEEYFAGNRLYIEVGFLDPLPGMAMKYGRIFVDFVDRTVPPYVPVKTIILATTIPAAAIVGVVILSIILAVCLYQRHKKRKMNRFLNPLDYASINDKKN